MASFVKPVNKSDFVVALTGLIMSTGGAVLWEPMLNLSQKNPDRILIFLLIYGYQFLLIPLTFYLNMVLLLLHFRTHAGGPEGVPVIVFLHKHVPQASHAVSLATLIISGPLYMHAAVAEESIGLAIGAALLCLALIAILTSVLKTFFVSRDLKMVLFTLFISTAFFILLFSDKNHCVVDTHHIAIQMPWLFVNFFLFMLCITLLVLYIGTPLDGHHAASYAIHWVVAATRTAITTLLVGWYMAVYVEVTGITAAKR